MNAPKEKRRSSPKCVRGIASPTHFTARQWKKEKRVRPGRLELVVTRYLYDVNGWHLLGSSLKWQLLIMAKILFLDESGDHNLAIIDSQYPLFVLGGVIIEQTYAEVKLEGELRQFKRKWFGTD